MVSLAGEVDPLRPIVDLRFLVENDGPYVLEGVVVVTPPADWSGRLSVGPVPERESGTSSDPLWQPTAFTGPGQTEPITVPVRYRVWRGEVNCRGTGPWVTVGVQVRVAGRAVERASRLQVPVQIPLPTGADLSALCAS